MLTTLPTAVIPALPPQIALAADRFNQRHRALHTQGERRLAVAAREPDNPNLQRQLLLATRELSANRFHVKERASAVATTAVWRGPRRSAGVQNQKSQWKLDQSTWAPRKQHCDSRALYDSPIASRCALEKDWSRAVECGLGKFIARHTSTRDAGLASVEMDAALDEALGVLWANHELLYGLFIHYASFGGGDDVLTIAFNGYAQIVADFQLAERRSAFASKNLLDQIFIAVDASGVTGVSTRKKNKRLERHEFIHLLVRVAVARHLLPYADSKGRALGRSVGQATSELFSIDLQPQADMALFSSSNAFRRTIYVEEVDSVLRRFEVQLRAIFECIAGCQTTNDSTANQLVSHREYKEFLRVFHLLAEDLTERDATLCFTSSRMLVIDEQDPRRTKYLLCFEVRACVLLGYRRLRLMPQCPRSV